MRMLDTLLLQNHLTREEACAGVEAIIEGADPCQAAAFLVLLKAKGETGHGVAQLVCSLLISPFVYFIGLVLFVGALGALDSM